MLPDKKPDLNDTESKEQEKKNRTKERKLEKRILNPRLRTSVVRLKPDDINKEVYRMLVRVEDDPHREETKVSFCGGWGKPNPKKHKTLYEQYERMKKRLQKSLESTCSLMEGMPKKY